MKEGIHPNYNQTTITCACGNVLEVGSTKKDIKVASVKRSKDTFFELYKNEASFKKAYDDYMVEFTKNHPKGSHSSFKQFC